jgi:hypothetical protein
VEPASQDGLVTVALPSHGTVTVELLAFAVTTNVPEPPRPVSHVNLIVSGPAAAAKAVAEIASAAAAARAAARAGFKIDMIGLLVRSGYVIEVMLGLTRQISIPEKADLVFPLVGEGHHGV